MTLDQARSRAKQINSQIEIKRQEFGRKKIDEEKLQLNQKFTGTLPAVFMEEFELKYVTDRFRNPGWKCRIEVAWRLAANAA